MAQSKAERQATTKRRVESLRENQWKSDYLAGVVRHASVPILAHNSQKGILEPIASGVLNKTGGHVFIFTAGHALEDLTRKALFIPVRDGSFVQIEGTGHGSRALDAGVFNIENKDLAPFMDIALPGGVVFMQEDILQDRLILYGYPAREYKRDWNIISCPPRQFQMRGKSERAYKRAKRSPSHHILLNWPNKVLGLNGLVGSPSLAGMSGCGVWFVPQVAGRPLSIHALGPLPRLVGIFIEQRRNEATLVVTNVLVHARIVREAYPEIMEKSKGFYEERITKMRSLEQALGVRT